MVIRTTITECDFTGKKYDPPVQGGGYLVQGATGRWCVVMWAGPEYLEANNVKVSSDEEAAAMVEDKGGYADF
jgi:hypothetical protein